MAFTITDGVLTKYIPDEGETEVNVPEGVTRIDLLAFYYCETITRITLPAGIRSIGNSAFSGCSSLVCADLPDTLEELEDPAFAGCSSLESVLLPEGITELSGCVFKDCSSLKSVTFPQTLTSIGEETFAHCSAPESLQIPDSVVKIGKGAFLGCIRLTDLKKPAKKCKAETNAFGFCGSLVPSSAITAAAAGAVLKNYMDRVTPEVLFGCMRYLPNNAASRGFVNDTRKKCELSFAQCVEYLIEHPEFSPRFLRCFEEHFLEFTPEEMKKLYDFAQDTDNQKLQEKLLKISPDIVYME